MLNKNYNARERTMPVEPKLTNLQQPITNSSEPINSDDLINYLYDKGTGFEYGFALESEFQLPLYRERNFG